MPVTLRAIGEHLGLSTKTVALHRDAKVIPDPRTSSLDKIRLAYIAHLREIAAGRSSKDGTLDLAAERARLAILQQQKAELDIAERRRELIPATEIGPTLSMMIVAAKSALQSIPSRVRSQAPHMQAADVALMRTLVDAALHDFADALIAIVPEAEREPYGEAGMEASNPDARV